MPKSLWDIAIEQYHVQESESVKSNHDSSLIFLGNTQSGKSTLVNMYLNKSDIPKPTIALEYIFARHSRGLDLVKDVCHIWELGGGIVFTNLIENVITSENICNCCAILVADLSQPQDIWLNLEALISAIRSRVDNIIRNDDSMKEYLITRTKERLGEEAMNKNPLLIPVVILGSKYDLFQEIDSERKKTICKGLRSFAITNGIALYFVSSKSESLRNRIKGVISNLAFDLPSSKTFAVDHNKPLCIPFGSDSVHKIGTSSADDGKDFVKSYEMWKNTFLSTFPPTSKPSIPDDPASDSNFTEKDVDMIRQQKNKELEDYLKLKHSHSHFNQ